MGVAGAKYRSEPTKSKVWGCPRMGPVRIGPNGRPGPARARIGVNRGHRNRCEWCVDGDIGAAPYGRAGAKYRSEPAKSKVRGCPQMGPVRVRPNGRPGPARARIGVNWGHRSCPVCRYKAVTCVSGKIKNTTRQTAGQNTIVCLWFFLGFEPQSSRSNCHRIAN